MLAGRRAQMLLRLLYSVGLLVQEARLLVAPAPLAQVTSSIQRPHMAPLEILQR